MKQARFKPLPEPHDLDVPNALEEQEGLLYWMWQLSDYSAEQAALLLLKLTLSLKTVDLKSKQRRKLLDNINMHFVRYISHIEHNCWELNFPLSEKEQEYAELITWNFFALSEAFFIAAQDATKKVDMIFCLATSLHFLSQTHLHIAITYFQPHQGFWSLLYKIYALAEKHCLLDSKEPEFENKTLHHLLIKILIFQACDTNQYSNKDMFNLFNFLDYVCNEEKISTRCVCEQTDFIFDLASDNEPINNQLFNGVAPKSARFFSSLGVAEKIDRIIEQNPTWTGTKSVQKTLFQRASKSLSLKQKRLYGRESKNHITQGIIGFHEIIALLYGGSKQKITVNPQRQLFSEDDAFETAQTAKAALEPNKNFNLRKIKIFDSSANGYFLSWNYAEAKANINDVLGIISEDKKRLEILLIRHVVLNEQKTFIFGTEVLGFESQLVYLEHAQHDTYFSDSWAIFIPGIKLLEQSDTVIYSTGGFNLHDSLYIHKINKIVPAKIAKELHATTTITHAELAYLKA